VKNRSLHGAGVDLAHSGLWLAFKLFGIVVIYDGESLFANIRHQAYRTQESRGIIDQVKEGRQANEAEKPGNEHDQLMDGCLRLIQASYREQEGEHEQAHRAADDVVAQQRGGNDAGCVLPTRDLYGYKKRAKCKDDERKAERDNGIEQRLCALDPKPEKRQS